MSKVAAPPPEFFVDRSLGRVQVPGILRAAGFTLTTLAEHYGIPADESVEDTDWLELAGRNGWVALMADASVAKKPAEIATVQQFSVQCFALPPQLLGYRQAGLVLWHMPEISELCTVVGPFVYRVEPTRLRRIA